MHPLVRVGHLLREQSYQFTTITPLSHERVNARPGNERARSIRDVFGWSRPFDEPLLPPQILNALREADAVEESAGALKSRVRFSTYQDLIFVHSSFPTTESDAVFFGPDTYRYLNLLRNLAPAGQRAVDVGCGSGAGGILIARRCKRVVLADINHRALEYARINAGINGIQNVEICESNVLGGVNGSVDLVVSNPPYLVDDTKRVYRDGGGRFGEALSAEIVRQSLTRLSAGGRLILYTATAVVGGQDTFHTAVEPLIRGHTLAYREIDPDVFGEELERPAYRDADRLAVISLDLTID